MATGGHLLVVEQEAGAGVGAAEHDEQGGSGTQGLDGRLVLGREASGADGVDVVAVLRRHALEPHGAGFDVHVVGVGQVARHAVLLCGAGGFGSIHSS